MTDAIRKREGYVTSMKQTRDDVRRATRYQWFVTLYDTGEQIEIDAMVWDGKLAAPTEFYRYVKEPIGNRFEG